MMLGATVGPMKHSTGTKTGLSSTYPEARLLTNRPTAVAATMNLISNSIGTDRSLVVTSVAVLRQATHVLRLSQVNSLRKPQSKKASIRTQLTAPTRPITVRIRLLTFPKWLSVNLKKVLAMMNMTETSRTTPPRKGMILCLPVLTNPVSGLAVRLQMTVSVISRFIVVYPRLCCLVLPSVNLLKLTLVGSAKGPLVQCGTMKCPAI